MDAILVMTREDFLFDDTKGIKMGGKQDFRVKIPILVSPLTLAFRRNGKNLDNKRIRIDNKNFMNKEVLD